MTSREPAGAGLRGNPGPRTTVPAAPNPWTSRAYRLRWGAGLATAAALVAFAVAPWGAGASPQPSNVGATGPSGTVDPVGPGQVSDPSYGPPPASGTGRDPLTPAELDLARSLDDSGGGPLAGAEDVTGAVGGEQLSVELVARRPDGHRRAALYTYDYRTDRLVKQVVDLTAGRLEGSYVAAEMQPPTVPREVRVALDLLLADPLGERLRTRYRELAGRPLTAPDQLAVTAQTYLSPAGKGAAASCGRHRCVQLITQLPDGPFVDVTDLVVDLSGRTVVRLS
ncbi:hypothetical protein GCM10027614_34850 [Micromonospora vulcania]